MTVCGEDCSKQVCLDAECPASRTNRWDDIVDHITLSTLRDIVRESEPPRLIALACGHVFTVADLDRSVHLEDCYTMSDPGPNGDVFRCLGIKVPPPGYKQRPVCTHCRGPVDSPRYNRVCKRAMIDIQEQYAIHFSSVELEKSRAAIQRINFVAIESSIGERLKGMNLADNLKLPSMPRLGGLLRLDPTSKQCIDPAIFCERVGDIFEITGSMETVWQKLVKTVFTAYRSLARMVNTDRAPHVAAYEAAVTAVFAEEMAMATNVARKSHRDTTATAMLMARRRVGAPFPRGEARFKIEALIETIKIRLKLSPMATAVGEALRSCNQPLSTDKGRAGKRQPWEKRQSCMARRFDILAMIILRSARRDADLAVMLCQDSDAHRLQLSAELLVLECTFHLSRSYMVSNLAHNKHTSREAAAEHTEHDRAEARSRLQVAIATFRERQQTGTATGVWVDEHVQPLAKTVLDEWANFAITLRKGTFYSPVSLQEKMDIARAVLQASYGCEPVFQSGSYCTDVSRWAFLSGDYGHVSPIRACLAILTCSVPWAIPTPLAK